MEEERRGRTGRKEGGEMKKEGEKRDVTGKHIKEERELGGRETRSQIAKTIHCIRHKCSRNRTTFLLYPPQHREWRPYNAERIAVALTIHNMGRHSRATLGGHLSNDYAI